ncbi:SDR family oxidoreductase [Fervidibacter sacchari]|uniref:3-oxoacyl-[acyl-carrier protein] reductase n=1 Tax=Candidatus Fervidibacter sacchari TaxID=1448929 RepID=A0ABT2EM48_9BACT|nr:SDR family oxidoreductase [Candidatus Fervidibacter sacchari]MCS3919021.1 3-oxoacyl-[acyl-carrier protein] reductase [Candidatus Fervidibacter sacchari]WKU17245.1 SDR family oxidoreductase [Candidatus Fervidibacter sacchari]
MRLKGKVALIVGAGGPMGTAVSTLFAQEGAKVVLAARREEPLRELTERIKQIGSEATFVTGDALTIEGSQRMVSCAIERYGRLDILYHNIGDYAFGDKSLSETGENEWRYLIDVNLNSAFLPCRFAIPVLKQSGGGVIVFVSASTALRQRAHAGYAAAKAGLIGMTLNLARNLKPFNIRVHCLCPSGIGQLKSTDRIGLPTPNLNRSGEPEDVAYAALFLCSDEAAWLTGVVLDIDGGASLSI